MKRLITGLGNGRTQIKSVDSFVYAEFLKITGKLLKKDGALKKDRQILDEVLKKDGCVLMARIGEVGEKSFPVGFLVAAPKGNPKVVGMLSGLTNPKKSKK